jgi:hypothetical protein
MALGLDDEVEADEKTHKIVAEIASPSMEIFDAIAKILIAQNKFHHPPCGQCHSGFFVAGFARIRGPKGHGPKSRGYGAGLVIRETKSATALPPGGSDV